METVNLATELPEQELGKIGQEADETFRAYLDSREPRDSRHAEYKRLYYQISELDKKKTSEYQGSKVSMPILTEAANLFQARGYKAFFPTREFIQAIPIVDNNGQAELVAERIAKHMTYQLTVEIKNYRQDKSAMLLATAIHGSDFTKAYFDPIKGKNIIERVRAEDFVVPYGSGPRNIEDIEDKFQIIWLTASKAKYLHKTGYFAFEPEPYRDSEGSQGKQVDAKVQGLNETETNDDMRTPRCVLERHFMADFDNDGMMEPYIMHLCRQSHKVLRISINYRVDERGEATQYKQPIERYTHYKFLENPDGFYGLGFGSLLGELNIATNDMIRSIINAGELANVGNMSGFISERLGIKGGDLSLKLGKFLKIPKTVDDIKSSILPMNFQGPNASYVQTLQYLEGISQRLGNTTDAATGDVQKVMQPLTIMTLLESTLQLPTSIMEQQAIAFESELDKLYQLNQMHLKTPQDFAIEGYQGVVFPEDYQSKIRVFPIIDPKMITKQQKIAKAQALYQFGIENPLIAQNPQSIEEITRRMLVAMEADDIDQIMPAAAEPQRIDDQNQENYLFLQPQPEVQFDVFPDQNHQEHLAIIGAFMQTPEFQQLPPQTQEAVLIHRQKHLAYNYGQQTGAIDGQGQLTNMVGEPNNPMAIEQFAGGLQPGTGDMGGEYNGEGGAPQGPTGGIAAPEGNIEPGLIGLGDIGVPIPDEAYRR